jgi:hypothetical protein
MMLPYSQPLPVSSEFDNRLFVRRVVSRERSMGIRRIVLLLVLIGAPIAITSQASHVRVTNLTVYVRYPESALAGDDFFGRPVVILRRDRTVAPVIMHATALDDQGWLRDLTWSDENSGEVLAISPVLSGDWVGGGLYEPPTSCNFDIYLDGEKPLQCVEGFHTISLSARDDAGRSATNSMTFEVITLKTALADITAAAETAITNARMEEILQPLRAAELAIAHHRFNLARARLQRFQKRIYQEYQSGRLPDAQWWPLAWSTGRAFEATRKVSGK